MAGVQTTRQTDHHDGEAAGPPGEGWLPRDGDEQPETLSPDMSEAVLVPGLPMMLEERHRSYSLDSLPLLEDFSPGQPASGVRNALVMVSWHTAGLIWTPHNLACQSQMWCAVSGSAQAA